jgi:uncharacterized protein (DUF362 family)
VNSLVNTINKVLVDNVVWVRQMTGADYKTLSVEAPVELPEDVLVTTSLVLLRDLLRDTGMDAAHFGTKEWNPLGAFIKPGHKVVLKPNWVSDINKHPGGTTRCLVTNAHVVEAILHYVVKAQPGSIIVGDAPMQGCDLPNLMDSAEYNQMKQRFSQSSIPVDWRDFRRTVLENKDGASVCKKDQRPLNDYLLFDLGTKSLLEPIALDSARFRVTMYNPDLMRQTHASGKHQYLIAREIMDADVIINLPKLKTHKKACVTGALKNMVGINGNKDYLPHHRLGGTRTGGDCYAGGNYFKLAAEYFGDAANRSVGMKANLLRQCLRWSYRLGRLTGADNNLEGSWHGNDTIWRTCLDLNRVLMYGKTDCTMADRQQRKIITLTDAIICGEGEGPLAPTPHPLGMLTLSSNPVAAEFCHAHLMCFDWRKIPLLREAFGRFRYPLCNFRPKDIEVKFNGKGHRQPLPVWNAHSFMPPAGWKGHCER